MVPRYRRIVEPMTIRLQSPAWLVAGLALLLSTVGALPQGTFQNLDFESASIPSGTQPGSSVPISSALPGWSGSYSRYSGTFQATSVLYDAMSLGGTGITYTVISFIDTLNTGYQPLQGSYSPFLLGGTVPNGSLASSTISQTGLVPNGTTSLIMDVYAQYGFTASLGGQTVNMVPLQTFPSYTLYGGDISAFAGQTAQLSITAPPAPSGRGNLNGVLLDDIQFSDQPIPEPSLFDLSAFGAVLLGWRVLGRRRCQRN